MKQSMTGQCFMSDVFDEDEIEIAAFLVDLKNLIGEIEPTCRFLPFSWGSRKKRSNRGFRLNSTPSSSSPSLHNTSQVGDNEIEAIPTKVKPEATSPSTPLSFSPSESDDKSKHSSRKSSKRKTRDELMNTINELSLCREALRGELENVRNYYNTQKAYNMRLKAMEEQVRRTWNIQDPRINVGQHYNQHNHQQPLIMDQNESIIHRFQYPLGQLQPLISSNNGLGCMNVGPIGIPDLNVTVEETFTVDSPLCPFDVNRVIIDERKAQFADARKRRMIRRIEMKRSSGFIRPPRRR